MRRMSKDCRQTNYTEDDVKDILKDLRNEDPGETTIHAIHKVSEIDVQRKN